MEDMVNQQIICMQQMQSEMEWDWAIAIYGNNIGTGSQNKSDVFIFFIFLPYKNIQFTVILTHILEWLQS